ncbi:MAG: D-alanyl-D-alanine carboxypeptidase/D-alanyl-D-alanine-endopeptidase [Bacteroides sp.]|nr:D-alanyl-D-alanine carboxypeptidase/D-alanyl-D-alanine-endopeptidase [Bacteroides sp.]
MKQILLTLLALCTLPLHAEGRLPQTDTTPPDSLLQARIDSLITHRLPAGSEAGISIYDLSADKPLYSYRADKLCRPASTMKLLTTITALDRPEADEPFRTEVWYHGTVRQDTLHGDLYVVGGFDPEFDDLALDSLVSQIAAQPFSVVAGHIYGDISMKDSLYWGSGWLWDDNPSSFQPYLSPLMLCKGCVSVTATPAPLRGDTALITCHPLSSYYSVKNTTLTRTPAAGRFRVTRNWLTNGNRISIAGNVDSRRQTSVNLYSSQDFFMHTFTERLQARGITSPTTYSYKELQKDTLVVRIASFETATQAVVDEIMKESDNLNAEALLCRLAVQATGHRHVTAEEGLDEVRQLMKRLGHDPKRYRLADGCGLSNYNYITPELLVSFLKYAYSHTDLFRKLYKALPIAGTDGTLEHRMNRGTRAYRNVHAKTGSFTAINCLAGYLRTPSGHQIAFAIMNQNILSAREARAFQDALCELLLMP